MQIDAASLEKALDALGKNIADRQKNYEIVAVGGGSLLLLGENEA